MAIELAEKTELERYLANALRDVSRTNALKLKPGLRILTTTNIQTFESVCSDAVQKDLNDFKKLLVHPETLAPNSTKSETDKLEIIRFIKQYLLNNLHMLDDRTSILPNIHMVQKSIMEGERLKSVVHTSALKNVIVHAHYTDALEKKFKEEGIPIEQCALLVEKAVKSTQELHTAVLEGNISKILKCLSIPGVDVNFPDNQGMAPLHLAARDGLTETVKLLLTVPNIKVNAVGNNGWTALHIAARTGHSDIVDALLAMPNIDPNVVNSDGWTALQWAAWHGFTDIVTVLLTATHIDVNQTDKTDTSALHWAARNGQADVIKILLTAPNIQVNALDNEQRTPLHLAAAFNHKTAVEALLTSTLIEPNHMDIDGFTPLHWAARNGQSDILTVLLKHRDTLKESLDNNGMMALDWAKKNDHSAIVQILNPQSRKSDQKPNLWRKMINIFNNRKTPSAL